MDGFERRSAQKKQAILEAALQLFMEQGVEAPSVAAIAKAACVSQVTIYNYFESKQRLTEAVFVYYTDQVLEAFAAIVNSASLAFEEKLKKLIFMKKDAAATMHENLYAYFMRELTAEQGALRALYTDRVLPEGMRLMLQLVEEGKAQGYVDPELSNEAIFVYVQAFSTYFRQKDVYTQILPLTEELTKLFFYGIAGPARPRSSVKEERPEFYTSEKDD